MQNFENKVVVITGGTRGIGFEIARAFHEKGAQVCICGSSEENIRKAVAQLSDERPEMPLPMGMQTDVSIMEQNEKFLQSVIDQFGRIDVLVCNAGIEIRKPAIEFQPQEWDALFNTNVKSFFFGAAYAARHMMENGIAGSIIGIGSVNSVTVNPGLAVYAATKCSMSHLTECLTREWKGSNIRINCVAPGSIPTDINRHIYCIPENQRAMEEKVPLGRRGTRREVANVVTFLASDEASYIAGQTIYVDGGVTVIRG